MCVCVCKINVCLHLMSGSSCSGQIWNRMSQFVFTSDEMFDLVKCICKLKKLYSELDRVLTQ